MRRRVEAIGRSASEAERGDVAQRDERRDARNHIRFGEQGRVTLVRYFQDVDVEAALAWRDFLVSGYSDAGQERWLADNGIDLLRGSGRLAGPGVVEVGGVRHTAEHVVVACGADPVIPPIPGLRELDGLWTNREATGMKAVPRRLLVLGGGPVGVEIAQAVRRLGGEAVLVEGAERVLAREPAALGEAVGEVLRRDGIELVLGARATVGLRP